jgi:transposase
VYPRSKPRHEPSGCAAPWALKERERDDRDDEIARLKSKVGEITMDNELLYAKIEALEGKRPLAHRRSRR